MRKKKLIRGSPEEVSKDFSNKTVVIMLVLVVVVSILSMGFYISLLQSTEGVTQSNEESLDSSAQGVVSMVILPPPRVNNSIQAETKTE